MTADAALTRAEDEVAAEVADVLSDVADEFGRDLDTATEIVAAIFSVGSIAAIFKARLPRVIGRLLGVAETAADQAATDVDAALPDGWDDLPGRYEDGRPLPDGIGRYVTATEALLAAVGDRLADTARRELAAGLDAGETVDQLRDRLRAAFDRAGTQLGAGREDTIAQTETTRAWNTGTLTAAQDLTSPDRPLAKQWITRGDTRVRTTHRNAAHQIRFLERPFTVGGASLMAPGDPDGPASETVRCRCRVAVLHTDASARTASHEMKAHAMHPMAPALTAAGPQTGAMLALLPAEEDATRLALNGGEAAAQLHLTLVYLGDAADWQPDHREDLIARVEERARGITSIAARLFGASHWNSDGDEPCWVWAVGDTSEPSEPGLDAVRSAALDTLQDVDQHPDLPQQHSPWHPHICAAYSDDPALLPELEARLGEITLTRLRVAFGGEVTDIPLGPTEEEAPMDDQPDDVTTAAAGPPVRTWSTPGQTGIAFEDQETGDGRIFAAGALHWDSGPWPLQHADEMLMGHEGAELAGAIQDIGRDGGRITAAGVLYTGREAGADAAALLDADAPLGVSVDLDAVDVEFVDRTDDEETVVLTASLPSASVIGMSDGACMLTAHTAPAWTASGAAFSRTRLSAQLITGPGGVLSAAAVHQALDGTGTLTAAAGDPDTSDDVGTVVHAERSGDLLMRITRGRVRGATLVAVPAFAEARIVLDAADQDQDEQAGELGLAAAMTDTRRAVVTYVAASPVPVRARHVADHLGITIEQAGGHLLRAAEAGHIVRLAPGQYAGASTLPEGPGGTVPGAGEGEWDGELAASVWTAMRDTDPMPAAWFAEPTEAELPPGSGGVHYSAGRIWGWVAQAGEPHAGMPGRNLTIESLGDIDLTHFLRAKFQLDNGESVRAGALTMNVGHHRDGAECETAACQFDDSRTVAGIVTVGMNERGMWFSGAASPHMSDWDRQVFSACQPSYHMRQGREGRWQLRAVLSVPVPGHSSPLVAAVVERSNLALAASAAMSSLDDAGHDQRTAPGDASGNAPTSPDLDALTAALTAPAVLDGIAAALDRRRTDQETQEQRMREEIHQMTARIAPIRGTAPASLNGAHQGDH